MPNYRTLEKQLVDGLGLDRRPVAVTFLEAAPEGVEKFRGSAPSGCSFWRLAGNGKSFYTVPEDHYNCPIGSYTHSIPMPKEREAELTGTLGLMTEIGYIRMEEVPKIPTLPETPQAVVYAPLGETPSKPSVVVFAGKPRAMMLLVEAAQRAGVLSALPLLPRPTCMALPAALAHGAVTSGGCIGNRVYTEVGDDELYLVLRGADLEGVAAEAGTILSANAKLAEYHQDRRRQLASE